MIGTRKRLSRVAAAIAAALASPIDAQAVSLALDGLGQALIFPYYTVRSSGGGNAFNTYLSVVNATGDRKALRVRVREGRAGREALSFNLYLSPNDVWTAALVPTQDGARLITVDNSCTDPPLPPIAEPLRGIALNNFDFSGSRADGHGETLDRVREGYVEMIEMATLTGASATAITHNNAGMPANCAAIGSFGAPPVSSAAPTGGLGGSLTLVNVSNGQDFTLDASALADLSTRSFFRYPADSYPGFDATEIDPVSIVTSGGSVYRSIWTRPVDAVSAVLMRLRWTGEYVLDNATASLTDFVATLPTRHHYVSATQFAPPFTMPGRWDAACGTQGPGRLGEPLGFTYFNREERGAAAPGCGAGLCPPEPPPPSLCAAAGVASVRNSAAHLPEDTTRTAVLGSTTRGLLSGGSANVTVGFQNGWAEIQPAGTGSSLRSLAASTRLDLATGQVTTGAHTFQGLPVIGFAVRTFANGTLACAGAAACQGNYGGAFAFKYRRSISPP